MEEEFRFDDGDVENKRQRAFVDAEQIASLVWVCGLCDARDLGRADRAARACRKMGWVVVYLPAFHAFRVGQSRCGGKGPHDMAGPSAASVMSFSTILGQGVRCGLLPSLQQPVPTRSAARSSRVFFRPPAQVTARHGMALDGYKAKVAQRSSTEKWGANVWP